MHVLHIIYVLGILFHSYMTRLRYYSLSVLSAVPFAFSIPGPLFENGSVLLGMIALAPHLYTILRSPDRHTAAGCGFLFGLISSGIGYYWLIFYRNFAFWTISSVSLTHGLVHIILALVIFRTRIYHRAWRPFVLAALWAGTEYMKSIGYLALPWGGVGLAMAEWLVLIQHIELTGPWTLHYVVAFINAVFVEFLLALTYRGDGTAMGSPLFWVRRQALIALMFMVLVVSFGIQRMNWRMPITDTVPLLIVQQNTDAWNEGVEAAVTANISLSRSGLAEQRENSQPAPELIIWSENSIGIPYNERKEFYQSWPPADPLLPFILESGTPLLSGSPYSELNSDDQRRVYNSALLIDAAGEVQDYYGKRHLVPFGEHVPFWDYQFMQNIYRNVIGLVGTWNKGVTDPVMVLPRQGQSAPLTFGTLICFEDSFAYLARDIARKGGDLLINLTNNAWSRRRSAQVQHLSAGRLRTIETRLAMVRSTNSGESVLINAYGEIEARLPSFQKGYLQVEAPIYDAGLTLYVRWGDWLGQVEMWGGFALWVLCFVRRKSLHADDYLISIL